MLLRNDLYDLTAVFVLIRSDITNPLNSMVLKAVLPVLNDAQMGDNQIRKAIATIEGLDEKWDFVYHNNVYVSHTILKQRQIYTVLIKCVEKLQQFFAQSNFNQAYDLIDSIHCLPDIVADNCFSITKNYWKNYMKHYRSKWDSAFLVPEQKALK